jgi:hypothetical protein
MKTISVFGVGDRGKSVIRIGANLIGMVKRSIEFSEYGERFRGGFKGQVDPKLSQEVGDFSLISVREPS